MSSEIAFFRFLKSLPRKERNLYLWLNCYREQLSKSDNLEAELRNEMQSLLKELFETEIKPSEDNLISEIKPKSSPKPAAKVRYPHIDKAERELDEKLGSWASSFSDDDSYDELDEKSTENVVPLNDLI